MIESAIVEVSESTSVEVSEVKCKCGSESTSEVKCVVLCVVLCEATPSSIARTSRSPPQS